MIQCGRFENFVLCAFQYVFPIVSLGTNCNDGRGYDLKDVIQDDTTSLLQIVQLLQHFPLLRQAILNETVGSSNRFAVIVSIRRATHRVGISKVTIVDHVQSVGLGVVKGR